MLTLTVVTVDGWAEDQGLECVELIPNYHPITMLMNSNHNTIDEVPFQLPAWCPFTSFLFFLTQNIYPLVPEERRKEKHASHSASQQQIIKRDIWRQLRDIFGGVDPFYGLNVVNHMKVFLLMMTLQSSVTLPKNKATSFSPKMVFFIFVIYLFLEKTTYI